MKKSIMKTVPNDNTIPDYRSVITIDITIRSMELLFEAYMKYTKNNPLGLYRYAAFQDSDFNGSLFISQTQRATNFSFPFNVSGLGSVDQTKTKDSISLFNTFLSPRQQINWQLSFDNSTGDQAEISYILFDYLDANVQAIFYTMPECYAGLNNNQPYFFFRAYTNDNLGTYNSGINYSIYLRFMYQESEFRISIDPLIQTRK